MMRNTFNSIVALAGVVSLIAITSAEAAPILGIPEKFDADLSGWVTSVTGSSPAPTVTWNSSLGGQAALGVAFGLQGFPEPQDATFYAVPSSTIDFTGNYLSPTVAGVSFNFYADSPIDNFALFFHSTVSGGAIWQNVISSPSIGWSLSPYAIPFNTLSWTSTSYPSGDLTALSAALASVDQIGFLLERPSSLAAQNYGIDNFELLDDAVLGIPEPSTYAILAFTFLTLGLTLRRKRLAPVRLAVR